MPIYNRWEYAPEYINSITTPDDLRDAIKATLQHWLDIHTDPEAWAAPWLRDYEPIEAFKEFGPTIENNYFSIDWRDRIFKTVAENEYQHYYRCTACGCIWHSYDEHECDDWDADEEGSDEPEQEDATKADVLSFWEDIYYDPNELPFNTTDQEVFDALVSGFDEYKDAVHPLIEDYIDEMRETLEQLDSDDNQDVLVAMLRALHQMHHNGQVLEDYGDACGLDWKVIDEVNTNGLAEVFGEDVANEWLFGVEHTN